MDKIKSAVSITLDFFKIIDRFKKEGKAQQSAGEKDNCHHNSRI
jgi:hypothetical protein